MMRRILTGSSPRPGEAAASGGAIAPQPLDGPQHALLHPDDRLVPSIVWALAMSA